MEVGLAVSRDSRTRKEASFTTLKRTFPVNDIARHTVTAKYTRYSLLLLPPPSLHLLVTFPSLAIVKRG